jgi:hypothetical protein
VSVVVSLAIVAVTGAALLAMASAEFQHAG